MSEQVCFSNKSSCSSWLSNNFKKDKCSNCCFLFTDHCLENVSNNDIINYLDYVNAKNPCNEILPSSDNYGCLYLGSFTALSEKNITKYNITKGVQTAKNLESFFAGWGIKLMKLEKDGVIELLRLHWVDAIDQKLWKDNIWDQLIEAITWIHNNRKKGENVLVNCAAGKSRSSTLIIAYLMCINNINVEEALKITQSKRSIAQPNDNFIKQLQDFEKSQELNELRNNLLT